MTATSGTIQVVFRGVRGSHPMPGPTTLRYGGNTTCQEIRVGGRLLIFDTGTGIIGLGKDMVRQGGPDHIAIFYSHNHHDHIDGLLYFKPAYNKGTVAGIYGPVSGQGNILDALEMFSCPAAHPVQFSRMGMRAETRIIEGGDVLVWAKGEELPRPLRDKETPGRDDVVVRILRNSLHPVEGVLNFRVEYRDKSYVYATDVEGDEENGDSELVRFAQGANLLSHDGQYQTEEYRACRKGWGHSTIAMAIRTAELAGVDQLAIIHHDPDYSDDQLDAMEREAKKAFPRLFLAQEGQVVDI